MPEVELKFELSEPALAELAAHPAFAQPPTVGKLRSTYFDTPGRDLQSAGFGLRIRATEGGYVQTLKGGSGGPLARGEWEVEVEGERPDSAAFAGTPADRVLNGDASSLEPVFATSVERAARRWTRGGCVVEVSVDRGEITAGRRREPVHELELELLVGDRAGLFDLARSLTDLAPLRLSFDSKAERGYRLAAGEHAGPRQAGAAGVHAGTSAADGLRRIGWSCLAQIGPNVEHLRRRRSPEALHQARVGLRRLRAALTTFKPMAAGRGFEEIKAETKWLAGELDAARNLDVFIQEAFVPAEAATDDRSAYAALGVRLLAAQQRAYERALAAADSRRYAALMLTTAAWLEVGDWSRSDEPVLKSLREAPTTQFACERLDWMHRRVMKSGRKLAVLDAGRRHRLRIKAKKLRYAAEFFADAFGEAGAKRRRRVMGALEDLQESLGQLNDLAVARRLVPSVIQDQPPEVALAAGLILGARQGAQDGILSDALEAFASLEDVKPFWR